MLGVALAAQGRLDEANDRNQRALRDDPVRAEAQKKTRLIAMDQGIINYQRTLGIDPSATLSRASLGLTPGDADRLNEAIGHYEKAVRIEPWLWLAHAARGQALVALGRFREALTATRRCLDRLPQGHELRSNVVAQLGRCERLIALQDRLSAVLQGNDKAADASEAFEFAELCGILGQPAAAARLYAEGLDASPRLADDLHAEHRYRAACAATLVGCGPGATLPGRAKRSGPGGASGHGSGFGPRSPSGATCWTAVRRQIACWSPRNWRICGPILNWTGCWTAKRWTGCRRPSTRNAAHCATRSISRSGA